MAGGIPNKTCELTEKTPRDHKNACACMLAVGGAITSQMAYSLCISHRVCSA